MEHKYRSTIAYLNAKLLVGQCGQDVDTAQHVLEVCPYEEESRRELVAVVGSELSLATVITKMVESERSWEAMVSFCEAVVSRREAEERERELNPIAHPRRRARRRRRANRARTLSPFEGSGVMDVGASSTLDRLR